MPTATPKDQARRVIDELPDDATYEDVIERLIVVHKVERGRAEARAGDGLLTQSQVEAHFARRRRGRS